jgi:hypothetical protein
MCLFSKAPKMPDMPDAPAAMKFPDGGQVRSSIGRRIMDRVRSAATTVLTGGQGVTSFAPTEKKTLLGA